MIRQLWKWLLLVGPGIFCIGYTIGTGSVTTMAKSGSIYGMQLLWVLALSCLFSWVLMEAYGRFAVVTGGTAINGFKKYLKFGKILAITTIIGVVIGQWNSLSGILGLSSHALYEVGRLFFPSLPVENYWLVLLIAFILIVSMYGMMLVGRYSFFEKILIIFVTIMGIAFFISMFIVLPPPGEIARGFIPSIPKTPGSNIIVAAFVGTTMAAPTFVVRPLLMKEKGWKEENTKDQSRDAFISALFMFIISGSIMVCATGAMFYEGRTIEKVLDMVYTLEPVAGRFAVAIFMVGTISAGLSSIFPIMMVAPLLISDYKAGKMEPRSKMFRWLTAVACLVGLTVPVLGANPIAAQIATQVANVFVLPLVIGGIMYLVNQKSLMGKYNAGILLNIGMSLALIFACIISYKGIIEIINSFRV
jgi:Mn2+/Fe2+ NRAMP family transporter